MLTAKVDVLSQNLMYISHTQIEKELYNTPPQGNVLVCGGLHEKCPHELMYLNTWSPVGGAVWFYGNFRRRSLAGRGL